MLQVDMTQWKHINRQHRYMVKCSPPAGGICHFCNASHWLRYCELLDKNSHSSQTHQLRVGGKNLTQWFLSWFRPPSNALGQPKFISIPVHLLTLLSHMFLTYPLKRTLHPTIRMLYSVRFQLPIQLFKSHFADENLSADCFTAYSELGELCVHDPCTVSRPVSPRSPATPVLLRGQNKAG